jgi:hypothetical protein
MSKPVKSLLQNQADKENIMLKVPCLPRGLPTRTIRQDWRRDLDLRVLLTAFTLS